MGEGRTFKDRMESDERLPVGDLRAPLESASVCPSIKDDSSRVFAALTLVTSYPTSLAGG